MAPEYGPLVQPLPVRVRHVKLATAGTTQLGKVFAPTWTGLNGTRGFVSGTYEMRLGEEGTFTLVLPNGPGEDGILHRDRFDVVSRGKRNALAIQESGQKLQGGGVYRPGDEWIEVWQGEPGQLVFNGTPTRARVGATQIEISGVDAFWLQRKARETAAGFWCHAPRDVFEHYTGVWQTHLSAGFEPGGLPYTWSTTAQQQIAPEVVSYSRAATTGDYAGPPGTLRLHPRDVSADATFYTISPFMVFGLGSGNEAQFWRVQCTVQALRLSPSNNATLYFGFVGTNASPYLHLQTPGTDPKLGRLTLASDTVASFSSLFVENVRVLPPFDLAVEMRDRWLYYYFNGTLVGIQQNEERNTTTGQAFVQLSTGASGRRDDFADISRFVVSKTTPFLMRGADKGDYHLPGAPPMGGLQGEYFIDAEIHARVNSNTKRRLRFNPSKEAFARRADPATGIVTSATQQASITFPPGTPNSPQASLRWTGSVYLDLASADAVMHKVTSGHSKIWVGKTRFQDVLFRDDGSGTQASGNIRAHLGSVNKAGWYPFIGEFGFDGVQSPICLVYWRRSDWPSQFLTLLGMPDYYHYVAMDAPDSFWHLGFDSITDRGSAGWNLTMNGAPEYSYTGPFPGLTVTDFDSTNDSFSSASVAVASGTNSHTVEAWILMDQLRDFPIVTHLENVASGSADGWDLFATAAGALCFRRWVAGTAAFVQHHTTLAPLRWYHVVAVYDGANLRLYLNGVAATTPVAEVRSAAVQNQVLLIGTWPTAFNPVFADGKIANVAYYTRALSAVEVLEHWNAVSQFSKGGALSPFGIHKGHVRHESHYDAMKQVAETFVYQFTAKPKQLESAAWPAEVIPRVREGRDTEKVIDSIEAEQVTVEINAEDVCDVLLADASGLATETQASQLVGFAYNYDQLNEHLILAHEYESLAEINFRPLLQQRIDSLMALRGSAWESVGAGPKGMKELLDSFPLVGVPAEFAWEPGDGVRLLLPSIGIEDGNPRQILGVSRNFTPDGIGRPDVRFRQRPRNLKDYLRKIQRVSIQPQRYYQGQLVMVTGTLGVTPGGTMTIADTYSRAPFPTSPDDVVQATIIVHVVNGVNTFDFRVNSNAAAALTGITTPGRYDITHLVAKDPLYQRMYVEGIRTAGTGSCEHQLELIARV